MPAPLTSYRPKEPKSISRARNQIQPFRIHRPASTPRKLRRHAQKKRLRDQQSSKPEWRSNVHREQAVHQDDGEVNISRHFGKFSSVPKDSLTTHTLQSTDRFVFRMTPDHTAYADVLFGLSTTPTDRVTTQAPSAPKPRLNSLLDLADSICSPPSIRYEHLPHGHPAPRSLPETPNNNETTLDLFSTTNEFSGLKDHYIPSPVLYHKRSREMLTWPKEDEASFHIGDRLKQQCCEKAQDEISCETITKNRRLLYSSFSTEDEASCFIAAALPLMGPMLLAKLKQESSTLEFCSGDHFNDSAANLVLTPTGWRSSEVVESRMRDDEVKYPDMPDRIHAPKYDGTLHTHSLNPERATSRASNHHDSSQYDWNSTLEHLGGVTATSQVSACPMSPSSWPTDETSESTDRQTAMHTNSNSDTTALQTLNLAVCPSPRCLALIAMVQKPQSVQSPATEIARHALNDPTESSQGHSPSDQTTTVEQALNWWSKDLDLDLDHATECMPSQRRLYDIELPLRSADAVLTRYSDIMMAAPLVESVAMSNEGESALQTLPAVSENGQDCCIAVDTVSEISSREAQSSLTDWEDLEWESASDKDENMGLRLLGF